MPAPVVAYDASTFSDSPGLSDTAAPPTEHDVSGATHDATLIFGYARTLPVFVTVKV
ncbi:MAG TPA: hypothetical protein VKH19_15870 [Gemmatimonadaceae bacterium]|nr:hypothetical protein [Gemmatimonadaceae bacterium]